MNRYTWIGCGLLVACLVVGCGKSDDDVIKDQIAAMNETAAELEKLDSKEAAEKAKSKFEALQKRMDENEKIIKAWPKDKQEAMEKKYKKEIEEAGGKVVSAILKVGPKVGGEIPGLKKPG